MSNLNRRQWITAAGATLLSSNLARAASPQPSSFLDILRHPDSATAYLGLETKQPLTRSGEEWHGSGFQARLASHDHSVTIRIAAPACEPTHLHLRWNQPIAKDILILGDAWERSYGELRWSTTVPERPLPWYFLTSSRDGQHGCGVKTGANALCFWQVDAEGVSLWLDIGNGGNGVQLGQRELEAATIVVRRGTSGEPPLEAARGLCRLMCDKPRRSITLLHGSNDWYYAYGKNTADQIVRDAELIASLASSSPQRPFTVVDDGWQTPATFPSMAALAANIRSHKVRPGLWIRPLQAKADTASHLLLPKERFGPRRAAPAYDPTNPEALAIILAKVAQARDWGYDLIKHDFSTFELFGRYGFEFGARPALPGWSFHDRSRTSAEIVSALYRDIRKTAGDATILVGCNTIGHLAAGLFDGQRTGDDVSGRSWEHTRRFGINTLAFRLPQNRTFFLTDADCVPVTPQIPWADTRQWLDLVARSGTTLLISPDPAVIGPEQRAALKEAFALSAAADATFAPVDWHTSTTPEHWRTHSTTHTYHWYDNEGAWPFTL